MKQKIPRRRIVIGDVHGCIEELKLLLDRCKFKQEEDRLIFVGDLVDKGPASREVVNLAMELDAECVLGNHDEKHLRWNRWLRRMKADPTVKNPMKHNGFYWTMTPEEQDYFESMPLYILDRNWCIVHAGLECDGRWPHQMEPKVMIRIRDVHEETGRYCQGPDPAVRSEGAVRWAKQWNGPVSVVYGHAPSTKVKLDLTSKGRVCLGIDTGAVHGGYLTATVIQPLKKAGSVYNLVQVRAKDRYADPYLEEDSYYVEHAEPDDPGLIAEQYRTDVGEPPKADSRVGD